MRVFPSKQSTLPPPDKPLVLNPVLVEMDVPMFYMTERGPTPWDHKVFCGKAFADTVLKQLNQLLKEKNQALVHIGFYNPRKARKKDGTPIIPERWSNHAYAEAVDFKGVILNGDVDSFVSIKNMKASMPDQLALIKASCESAIVAIRRKAEIVDEGDWLHIGLWPS